MTTLKRLSVVMSVLGTGLVVAACASPTDAEMAEAAQQEDVAPVDGEDVDTASSALADEAEEAAEDVGREAEDVGREAEDVGREAGDTARDVEDAAEHAADEDEDDSVSQEQRYGYGRRPGAYGNGPRCNYRDVAHCVRNHRGWRWVDLGGRGGQGGEYGRYGDRQRGNYCCMRVHSRDHRGTHRRTSADAPQPRPSL